MTVVTAVAVVIVVTVVKTVENVLPSAGTPTASVVTVGIVVTVVTVVIFSDSFSGYAYSFSERPEEISIMRKWEGDDPGINNQKTPTVLLLTPEVRLDCRQ